MSFSDMMSSGRGPGVIGMVMALFVLVGFGILFMFAFDEGMQGGGQSIEAVIRQQARDIENSTEAIEKGKASLALAPVRTAAVAELSRLKRENTSRETSIATLKQGVEVGNTDLAKAGEDFESYKDEYRAIVRGRAKGQAIEKLETSTGLVYTNVSIREVTAVGIQIRHDDGQKRIPFEELPEKMKDYFQFDPAQKEKAIASENSTRDEHEAAVAVADEIANQEMDKRREADLILAKEKLTRDIATKNAQISALSDEIRGLERDIDRAASDAAAARASGRMHISKAGTIRSSLRAKQNRMMTLQSEVAQMKGRL